MEKRWQHLFGRQRGGNMIILVCFMLTVFTLALVVGLSYGSLVFMQNRLRTSADEIALAGARKLNNMDRIGQMNNMIARSRQLVFTSKRQLDEAGAHYPQIEHLASRLHQEARDTALELESQRQYLQALSRHEADVAMQDKFNQLKGTYPMTLPWLRIEMPTFPQRKYGKIKEVECNTLQLKNVDELEGYDSGTYISSHPGLQLYRDGINARLPSSDSDLDFKLSSLPTPVENNINPARLVLRKSFTELASDEIPSATTVRLEIRLGTGLGASASNKMLAIGTAAATGACPAQ